jgi:hypothetical protein
MPKEQIKNIKFIPCGRQVCWPPAGMLQKAATGGLI